jgi:hypothetical protein
MKDRSQKHESTIRLGFELGSGEAVDVPVRNMCITGQTQESGKTTTLEALVHRSGKRAVAFVTKRHESGFADARRIAPYFRERADWQFVASVLEATLKQRMNFQRSWIMKLCESRAPKPSKRGVGSQGWNAPRSLADVLANVEIALQTATGIHEGVYTELRGYLRMVVPQIERLPYSTELRLEPGLNVMNLVEYSTELQALVIRSVLEWIYEQESDTVTVIPEAWEFLPQKRGSPVKLAAEALIRKGSAGRNYIWLDSQDLANVDKDIVRSCPVMILGVQRESNETKRTIAHIPSTVQSKPKPRDIMTLGLGEFVVCFGKEIRRVYVQPAWLSDASAQLVALGKLGIGEVQHGKPAAKSQRNDEEDAVYKQKWESEKGRADNLQRELDELRRGLTPAAAAPPPEIRGAGVTTFVPPEPRASLPTPPASLNGDAESMYQYVVQRLAADPPPSLIQLLRTVPEIEILRKRETIQIDSTSVKGRLAELIAEGFFNSIKRANAVPPEVAKVGITCTKPAIYQALDDLTSKRFLIKTKGTGGHIQYQAVAGMKVNIVDR